MNLFYLLRPVHGMSIISYALYGFLQRTLGDDTLNPKALTR